MKLIETINNINEGIFYELQKLNTIKIINKYYKEMNIEYYYNYSGEKTITTLFEKINDYSELAKIISAKYNVKWNKLYDTLMQEYNPIYNYNMEENEELKMSNDVYGFNSQSNVPNTLGTNIRKFNRKGNIGVTTTQRMMKEEFEVRKIELFSIIYKDIDSVLCLLIY